MNQTPILSVKNVCKSYQTGHYPFLKKKQVLDNLSFHIKEGEIYGILGNNGAGKTTTLRLLSTLAEPDSGRITYQGENIRRNPGIIRKDICFLTDALKPEPHFTPDYLFDYYARLYKVPRKIRKSRKKKLFKRLGLTEHAKKKISTLSTGTRQKAAIAIALAHDPKLIIFDEPTNGLDIFTARFVIEYLLELKAEGKTILLTSHVFDVIEKTCDRIGILIDGHMASEETIQSVHQNYRTVENYFYNIHRKEAC